MEIYYSSSNISTFESSAGYEVSVVEPSVSGFTPFFLTDHQLEGCGMSFEQNDLTNVEKGIIGFLALVSISTSIAVASTIFWNPKLRLHPSKLIGYMCVCEAASCFAALVWVVNPMTYSCYFGLHYVWSGLIFNGYDVF